MMRGVLRMLPMARPKRIATHPRFGAHLVAGVAMLVAAPVPAAGIDFFQGAWRDAFKAAERNDKAVFVDVYTEWCGPCKLMDANVYPAAAAGAYFNPRFVNVKIDAEDEAIDGPAFAKRYDIGGYPTLLFLRPDGTEIGRGVAGLGVDQLLRLAAELTGEATSDFAALLAKYEAGDRDLAFTRTLLRAGQLEGARIFDDFEARVAHRERMAPVFDHYFAASDKPSLINASDFEIIASYKDKTLRGDPVVEFVIANYDARHRDTRAALRLRSRDGETPCTTSPTRTSGDFVHKIERFLAYVDAAGGYRGAPWTTMASTSSPTGTPRCSRICCAWSLRRWRRSSTSSGRSSCRRPTSGPPAAASPNASAT